MGFVFSLALVLAGSVGGCGDDTGDVIPPDSGRRDDAGRSDAGRVDSGLPGISLTEFCDQVKVDYVEFLAECYGTRAYDPSDTVVVDQLGEHCYDAVGSVNDGRLAFDGSAAAACLLALENESCDRFVFFSDVPECQGLLTGLVPTGGDCYPGATRYFIFRDGSECAGGFCTATGCPGTCRAFAQLGQTCGGADGVLCAEGLHCLSGTCRENIAEREPCSSGVCQEGLQCLPPMPPPEPTCQVPVRVGEGCAVSAVCETGSFCSGGTCRSKVMTGAPCEANSHCPETDTCQGDPDGSGPGQGTCTARAPIDEPCTTQDDCDFDLVCVTNTCQRFPALDQPCLPPEFPVRCEEGLWCQRRPLLAGGDICTAPGAMGDSCAHRDGPAQGFENACQEGLFCSTGGTCLPPGGADEPCLINDPSTCRDGLFCDYFTVTCRPSAAMGESCNFLFEGTCAAGLGCRCSTGTFPCGSGGPADTCQPLVAEGGACARDSECEPGACEGPAGTCVVRGGIACLP